MWETVTNNYNSNSKSFTALHVTYSIMGHERTSPTEAVGIFCFHSVFIQCVCFSIEELIKFEVALFSKSKTYEKIHNILQNSHRYLLLQHVYLK